METDLNSKQVAELISESIRIEPEIHENIYEFTVDFDEFEKTVSLKLEELDQIIDNLQTYEIVEDLGLYNGNCYEALIREETKSRFIHRRFLREDGYEIVDKDNGITYCLSYPTDEYIVFLLNELTTTNPSWSTRPTPYRFYLLRLIERDEIDEITPFNLVRNSLPNFLTLQIESERDREYRNFTSLADAFIFQISFNFDTSLVIERFIEDLVRPSRIFRRSARGFNELEPPRRIYERDLIHHYQLAVSSESPPLEYLSLYHIIEHFFESVFEADLINRITQKITQPGFSYKRKNDVKSLIKEVEKSLKVRDQEIIYSEQEALRLTLEKYVEIPKIIDELKDYDETLIDYYKRTKVTFSKGSMIDLRSNNKEELFRNLSKRIYLTRNAIVHSKEGDRGKYIPFKHDKILIRDVPLLRFIAESIIIKTSELL